MAHVLPVCVSSNVQAVCVGVIMVPCHHMSRQSVLAKLMYNSAASITVFVSWSENVTIYQAR